METSSALPVARGSGIEPGQLGDDPVVTSAGDQRTRARKRKRRATPELLAASAVLAGVGAVALGTVSFLVEDSSGPQAPMISPAAQSALSLLAKPSTERVPLKGSAGTAVLAVGSGGRAVIVLKGFEPAPPGSVHHAWVRAQGGRFVEGGTFTGTERVVLLSSRVEPGGEVGVTTETSEVDTPSAPPRLVAVRQR